MTSIRSIPLLLTAALSPATATAQPARDLKERLRHALAAVVETQGLPGATAAVSIHGKVITVAAGMADLERRIPMTTGYRMLVGSAGKPFFAALVVQLAREGRLDLDAPIARWLGAAPWFDRLPNGPAITLRMLLGHRGGIINHVADSAFTEAIRSAGPEGWARGFTAEEQIRFALDRPPLSPPGAAFHYSDTGYLVAALALERAIGRTYYDELQSRILGPLGLRSTSPSDRPDLKNLAQGYLAPSTGPAPKTGFDAWGLPPRMMVDGRLVLNPVYEWTGGGLVSTSGDLARWMEALFETEPWKSVGDSMIASATAAMPYGLGIFVRTTADGSSYGHPGAFPGYFTQVGYSPSLGVGVAFQTNRSRADGAAAVHALLDAVSAR